MRTNTPPLGLIGLLVAAADVKVAGVKLVKGALAVVDKLPREIVPLDLPSSVKTN
jgi:hypothetical protein